MFMWRGTATKCPNTQHISAFSLIWQTTLNDMRFQIQIATHKEFTVGNPVLSCLLHTQVDKIKCDAPCGVAPLEFTCKTIRFACCFQGACWRLGCELGLPAIVFATGWSPMLWQQDMYSKWPC